MFNLAGGILAWSRDIDPKIPQYCDALALCRILGDIVIYNTYMKVTPDSSSPVAWPRAPRRRRTCSPVYQRALQNDPQLNEAEATRLAALESKPQALAALLPQISGSGTSRKEKDTGQSNQTETVQVAAGQPSSSPFPSMAA